MKTIKVCVTFEEKEGIRGGGGFLGYAVSNMSDRKSTIKLLRKIQNGNYWRDIAIDCVYMFNLVNKNIDVSDNQINGLLMRADEKKWEKFVKAFTDPRNGVMEIKKINVE